VGERPAYVEPILDRCDEPTAAGHALAVEAAQAGDAAERQLERGARVPAAGHCRPREDRLTRQQSRLEIGEQLVLDVNVLPLGVGARGAQVASSVDAAAADQQRVAQLEARVENERGVEVVVRFQRCERATDPEYRFGTEPHVLLSAHAVEAAPTLPPDVAVAEQAED